MDQTTEPAPIPTPTAPSIVNTQSPMPTPEAITPRYDSLINPASETAKPMGDLIEKANTLYKGATDPDLKAVVMRAFERKVGEIFGVSQVSSQPTEEPNR